MSHSRPFKPYSYLLLLWTGIVALPLLCSAQSSPGETREAAIEKERDVKAAAVKPWEPDKAEQVYLRAIRNPIVKGFLTPADGWTVVFGGLYPGSGFALGPKYVKQGLAKEQLNIYFSTAGSLTKYYNVVAGASLPHLFNDRAFIDTVIQRNDAPRVAYFGPGNASSKDSETRYRYENVLSDSRFAGPYVQWDTRDYPGDPHRGTHILAAYKWHDARKYSEYSFRRLQIGAEQYVPFFNEKRVLSFRAVGLFSYVDPGHAVPFYAQQTIGGPDDVRGLRRFRYYGNNSLVTNAEYRWEVAPGLAMALFADAGRVSDKPGHLALGDLHGAGGIGLRFKSRNAVVMRVDVGFSPQGVHFWWTFSDAFRRFFPDPF